MQRDSLSRATGKVPSFIVRPGLHVLYSIVAYGTSLWKEPWPAAVLIEELVEDFEADNEVISLVRVVRVEESG